MQSIFLGLLFVGIAALLAGVLLTRRHWREDIAPYGRRTRELDVILHPERYAEHAPLATIRGLNLAGAILLAAAVVVVLTEIVRTMTR